jgi:uncharacterized membrane protein
MFIQFSHPWFLLLGILLAFIWYISRRGHPLLSAARRKIALLLRLLMLTFLILALAGIKISLPTKDRTIFFLLDVSESINAQNRKTAEDYIKKSLKKMKEGDKAGIIVFARQAFVESLPQSRLEFSHLLTRVNADYTNIEAALDLAVANFPQKGSKKIVLLSDGNQNRKEARVLLDSLTKKGIKVDILPLVSLEQEESLLEALIVPQRVKQGEELKIKVIAQSFQESSATLKLYCNNELLAKERIRLREGQNVFIFPHILNEGGFYTYKAVLQLYADTIAANNEVSGYTIVEGRPKLLLLTSQPEAISHFIHLLEKKEFQCEIRSVFNAPSSLDELQDYDACILDDISTFQLSQHQLSLFSRYIKDLGKGLIAVGGVNSFGLGGYQATVLEEVLPVYAGIQQKLISPSLSLVLVMDKSGSMASESGQASASSKLSLAKKAALAVVNLLALHERIGVLSFDTEPQWTVPLQPTANKSEIFRQLTSLASGGGTSLFPALEEVFDKLRKEASMARHVIVLSDGLSSQGDFEKIIKEMAQEKITVSTVAIGEDTDLELMQDIAGWGKGKTYYTNNVESLPRIFTSEALRISRTLTVRESFVPIVSENSPILSSLDWQNVPPLEGYIITTPKQVSDVQLFSPRKDPLVVTWRYGLGRTAVFTSDLAGDWSKNWREWPEYSQFWERLINWVLPSEEETLFPLITVKEEKGVLIVDAIDQKGEFINFLSLKAHIVKPEDKEEIIFLDQTAPGRYLSSFYADEVGPYIISISDERREESGSSQIAGTIVPYSAEYRELTLNEPLLTQLSSETGGQVLKFEDNPFGKNRITFSDPQDIWPWLILIASLLLLADIGIRTVSSQIGRLLLKEVSLGLKASIRFFSLSKAESLEKYTHLIEKRKKRQEEKEISGRASRSVDTDDNESYYRLLDHLARRRQKEDNTK